MFHVKLIVQLIQRDATIAGYVRELDLPFLPCIGMKFEEGTSTRLWETDTEELNPAVEEVIYDLDEEQIVCSV